MQWNRRTVLKLAAGLAGVGLSAHHIRAVSATPAARASQAGPFLDGHRVISYYGTPLAPGLGVLGQGSQQQMLAWLREQAAAYATLSADRTVIPALHMIYEIAQSEPTANGLYLNRTPDAIVE